MNLKKIERYLLVNLLGPGPRLVKKRIYRAAVSQKLRNNAPTVKSQNVSNYRFEAPLTSQDSKYVIYKAAETRNNVGIRHVFPTISLLRRGLR